MITSCVALEVDRRLRPRGTCPLRAHIVLNSRPVRTPSSHDARLAPSARQRAKSRFAGPLYSCNYKRLILHVLYCYTLTNAWGVCPQYYVTLRKSILSCLLSMLPIQT